MATRMSSLICVRNRALCCPESAHVLTEWSRSMAEVMPWSSLGICLPPPFPTAQIHSTDAIPSPSLCLIHLFAWPHQAEPVQRVWLEKGKEKAGECFPSVCVHTCEGVIDVQLDHCTDCQSLQGCSIPRGHIRSALRGSTGVNKQWEEGRVEVQREMVQGYDQRHLCKVLEVNGDESRPNGLCNCHDIKNRLCCILRFHL